MHRPAFERVVEVLAVGGRAVHECGAARVERARMADRAAAARAFPPLDGGAHIVGLARRDAQASDVDQELFRRLAEIDGRLARAREARRQLLRDGRIRGQVRNYFSNGGAALAAAQPSATPTASATMSSTSKER